MSLWDEMVPLIEKELVDHPHDYLRAPTISKTMHPNQRELAKKWLNSFAPPWVQMLRDATDPAEGNPITHPHLCGCSSSTVQSIHHIRNMLRMFNYKPTTARRIIDIGGGYGNLCRIMFTLGFEGEYVLVDLPTMHGLQQRYLQRVLPREQRERVTYATRDNLLSARIGIRDLLVATFSVNEMPLEDRHQLEEIYSNFGGLYFAYNREIDGVDNLAYFSELERALADTHRTDIRKDPYQTCWYLGAWK